LCGEQSRGATLDAIYLTDMFFGVASLNIVTLSCFSVYLATVPSGRRSVCCRLPNRLEDWNNYAARHQ
jgi:hypothetical protein